MAASSSTKPETVIYSPRKLSWSIPAQLTHENCGSPMVSSPSQLGPPPGATTPTGYDAFLSYAHRDRQVAMGIQKGLHQIGRRLGQLRALRVFRDDTDLTASPDLWGRIT